MNAGPLLALGLVSRPLAEAAMAGQLLVASSVANIALFALFGVYAVVALAAAHQISRRRVAVAFVLVLVTWTAIWVALVRAWPGIVRGVVA